MYGSYRCPHCTNQKKLFGSGFKNIKYIECDPSSRAAQLNLCEAAGVTSWPTWVLPDGEKLVGETSLETLAEKTSCSLPSLTPTEGESTSMIDQTAPADEAAEPVTN